MGRVLFLLGMIAVNSLADIYQNCDGYTFSETALLSAPDPEADTLAVFSPGIPVTLFGRSARNDSTRGDSLYAAELRNAINSLSPLRN